MAKKYMKRCSNSLIIRETQIKTTMRYLLKRVRMATVQKKIENNKYWRWCGEIGTLMHCEWECKMVQPRWKTIWKFLRKLKVELPCDPAIPLLSIYPKELKVVSWRDICRLMFIAALLTSAKMWKQHKCPSMNEWIKKMWSIHKIKYYASFKKEGNPVICYHMHKPQRYYTKLNKLITKGQTLYDSTHRKCLKQSK